MNHTIEDAIEILNQQRSKFRTSIAEKHILSSLSKQFSEKIGLTDRQLDLCLKKISNNSQKLKEIGIDADCLIENKPLRLPMRQIDRSQWLRIDKNGKDHRPILLLKFDYSKDFSNFWSNLKETLSGNIFEKSNFKEIPLTESNITTLVPQLHQRGFDIDENLMKIYEKLEFIEENPKNFLPYIDTIDEKFQIKNANRNLEKYVSSLIEKNPEISDVEWLMTVKSCGICHKSTAAIEKISNLDIPESSKTILTSTDSRFRINPETTSYDDLLKITNSLKLWPILFIVQEDNDCFDTVKDIYSAVTPFVNNSEVTVFFRLSNGQKNHGEFNQFVRENQLNNYIDKKTKAVIISKNRIPKPLVLADWSPKAAVLISDHDYGKMSVYLNEFDTVFYYNDSVQMRHTKTKGSKKIVNL